MLTERMKHFHSTFIFCLALSLLAACSHPAPVRYLQEINSMADENPAMAMSMLDSIDYASLDEYNRHYYDFLRIKTSDKDYVRHTSDSLYQTVFRFFERKKTDPLYPEVVYYGGRVYSDLGDYPRALRYFQESIDLIPMDEANTQLRLNALSQTGRLLNDLRLHSQAVKYLEECVKIDIIREDSIMLPFDYQLLGSAFMHQKKYDEAEKYFTLAYEMISRENMSDVALMQGYLAALKYYKGDIDKAVALINGLPEIAENDSRDFLNAYASKIYMKAGILDSAYLYANKLIESHNLSWRIAGYNILLDNDLRNRVPTNLLYIYLSKYVRDLEDNYSLNSKDAVILQNSLYNYSVFEKENTNLTIYSSHILRWLMLALTVIFFLIAILVVFKYKRAYDKIGYLNSLERINSISSKLGVKKDNAPPPSIHDSNQVLKNRLKEENLQLQEKLSRKIDFINPYVGTNGYDTVMKYLNNGQNIPDNSVEWDTIEMSFNKATPDFKQNIESLIGLPLNKEDFRLLILIRFGLNTSETAIIFSKVKSTISSRRKVLNKKIFKNKVNLKDFNRFIYSL